MADSIHSCCDPASPSPIWEGKSSGKIITIDGIETYVAKARNEKGEVSTLGQTSEEERRVILHLTEGHSIYFVNAQLLADSFASQLNCDVIMPDQFGGTERVPAGQLPHFPEGKAKIPQQVIQVENDTITGETFSPPYHRGRPGTKEEFETWVRTYEPPTIDPVIAKVVRYIHHTYGKDVKIGGVGYCFGGRYVMRLMGSGVIDVGVVNHPSFFTLEEVEKLGREQKLAIYAADTDNILPAEKRRATEDVLTKGRAPWMSTVFSGTEHGFSVRGDLSIKEVRLAKEKAFRGAVEWFRDWL